MKNKKVIVLDIDNTITIKRKNESYEDILPNGKVLKKLVEYKKNGFYIVLYTSRNMNTYKGNIGLINIHTSKILLAWLDKHNIPYDEIYYGKPWCGFQGFYVDDKAIRPDEFVKYSYKEIKNIIDG